MARTKDPMCNDYNVLYTLDDGTVHEVTGKPIRAKDVNAVADLVVGFVRNGIERDRGTGAYDNRTSPIITSLTIQLKAKRGRKAKKA